MSGGLLDFDAAGSGGDDGAPGEMAEINVTPLVDVVLVLLVIFMITAPLLTATIPVDLPEVTRGAPAERATLVVSIDSEGAYAIEDRIVSLEDVVARAREASAAQGTVYLRADAAVSYGSVVGLLDLLRQEGVDTVDLVTQLLPGGTTGGDGAAPRATAPAGGTTRDMRRRPR